jgi:eukaryotic-like serine/threonine-protein kinase
VFVPGETLADRFVLERLAGAGAMGQVWLARDRNDGAALAVKVLARAEDEYQARFLREAVLLSQLDHPRIVRYVAHGLTRSQEPYLAMEWLEGEDLHERLSAGPLTIGETVSLVRHVAQALTAAHGAGIVHRDIKPSNLFLPNGSIEAVKIVDFGVAHVKDSTWTKTGLMLGTPAYMSPEQASGERHVDARADLFALGCVAFECATGRSAFGGKQVFAVLRRILLEEAPSLSSVMPDAPKELDALVKRMMAKDPAARPQSAAEVDALLEGIHTIAPETKGPTSRMVLSDREQRVVTALSIAEDESSMTTAATIAVDVMQQSPDGLDPTGMLRGLLDRTGGKISRASVDSSVLVFPSSDLPTDRAAQAAECALVLQDMWRGRAMALASGRTETGEWTDGHATDRASRLRLKREKLPAGIVENILIDEVTADLLDERYDVAEGAHGLTLRGNRERQPQGAVPTTAAPRTPFVGRTREVDALRAILDECVEEQVARAALVTAPAGMGKSRLRRELILAASQADAGLQVLGARGEPMQAGLPFGLIAQLAQSAKSASPESAAQSAQSPKGFVDLLARECEAGPVLIVLEDLQWGDAMSVQLLDAALRDLDDAAWMIAAFARPEVHQLFPRLWSDRPLEEIRLPPLTKGAGERIVRHVLGEGAEAFRVETILQQANGLPFYLELLGRAAAGGGQQIPEAALAMAQARLAKLDAHARKVLRASGIFGQTFWRGGVRALVGKAIELDDALQELLDEKLIAQRDESRFPGEKEFDFASSLIRESAYAMLTDADRSLGHLLAAEWLERAGEKDAATISMHRELGGWQRNGTTGRDEAG